MKIETVRRETIVEEISIEKAVNEFFDSYDIDKEWGDVYDNIEIFIEDFEDISPEEEEELIDKIKEEWNIRLEELKKEEISKLKDRKSIIEWIDSNLTYYPDEGEVGYMFSPEEILDLILENGQKV